jgi:glycosyltransferase involved in cell wall biosynthesis
MRLAVDATPLLGRPSGVGRYVRSILEGLAGLPDAPDTQLTLFALRTRVSDPPTGTRPSPRRLPARLLQPAWARVAWPPVEVLTGGIDVFHAGNFVLPPTRRAAGVVTVHDLSFVRHAHTVDRAVLRYRELVPRSVRRADAVMAITYAMREEICAEYGVPAERVRVSHCGVDPGWATAELTPGTRARLGLPDRYVVFTGNLEPRKNLGFLARAHSAARGQDPATPPLVLVGPPGWGRVWGDRAPDPSDVRHLGYLPEGDLRAVVAGATALCMPSVYEGFGMPVLEAMAAGTPVVASDIPAHREVASGHALLVDAADTDAWSQALADPPCPSAAGRDAARRHALSFTWGRSAREHLDVWREVANVRGR